MIAREIKLRSIRFNIPIRLLLILVLLPGKSALSEPHEIGQFFHFAESIGNIWKTGDNLFIPAGENGLQIYDFNDPTSPSLLYCYNYSAADYRYISDTLIAAIGGIGGVRLYDFSDTENPVLVSNFGNPNRHFSAAGNLIFTTTDFWHFGGFPPGEWRVDITHTIISIIDPRSPRILWLDSFETDGFYYETALISASRLFLQSNGQFNVYDINNPTNPEVIYSNWRDDLNSLAVSQDEDLLAAPPAILTCSGNDTIEPFSEIHRINWNMRNSNWIGWSDRNLLISNSDTFSIISFETPFEPRDIASFPASGAGSAILDQNLLTLVESRGIVTYDLQDPGNIESISVINNRGCVCNVTIQDSLLVVAAGSAGIKFLDISNPSDPRELGGWLSEYPVDLVSIDSTIMAVANVGNGMVSLVDISDLNAPNVLSTLNLDANGKSIHYQNGCLYWGTGDMLHIYNCRNYHNISQIVEYTSRYFKITIINYLTRPFKERLYMILWIHSIRNLS